MCLPPSVPEPAHRFALFYHFTPFCPALDCALLHRCDQSLPQRLPGLVKTHCTARFAQLDVLVTIPIDDRHGFTQRFSPTGFILNALDSTDVTQSFWLAFRLKPIRSVQSYSQISRFSEVNEGVSAIVSRGKFWQETKQIASRLPTTRSARRG